MEENTSSRQISMGLWALLFLVALAEIVIALDGKQYWHDIRFAYASTEFSLSEIFSGVFNPQQAWSESNEVSASGFYVSKMLHITLLHFLFSAVDPDVGGFDLAVTLSVPVMIITVLLAYHLYAQLLRSRKTAFFATFCLLLAPIVPYLTGKILSESTSLLFVVASLLLIVTANKTVAGKSLLLAVASGLFLAMAALARLDSLLGPMGFYLALFLVPLQQGNQSKQVRNISISLVTFAVTYVFILLVVGINPEILHDYFLAFVNAGQKPIVMSLLGIATFGGSIYLLAIAGMFGKQTQVTRFLLLWFSFTILPALLITWNYMVEPRYLIQSLLPLCALGAYGIHNIMDRFSAKGKSMLLLGSVFILMTVGLNYLLVRIMPYELDKPAMEGAIAAIKKIDPEVNILVPWSYSDYNFLQLVYSDPRIFNVNSSLNASLDEDIEKLWQSRFHRWYGDQYISEQAKVDELIGEGAVYYLGWTKYPPVQNVQNFAESIGWDGVVTILDSLQLTDHRKESWVWDSQDYNLQYSGRSGQYEYYRVSFNKK